MKNLISLIGLFSFFMCVNAQNEKAIIKIEKNNNGEVTIIEEEVTLNDGQDINSILQELGVLDELGNLKEGQSFEINISKTEYPDINNDIKIEYFDYPELDFELESKAYLGVMLTDLQDQNGVLISDIISGTAADDAGLMAGDIITELNGVSYSTAQGLVDAISKLKPDDQILLTYLREGNSRTDAITLGEKQVSPFERRYFNLDGEDGFHRFPGMEEGTDSENANRIFEFYMDDLTEEENPTDSPGFLGISESAHCSPDTEGVMVGKVTPNSAAEKMGLKEGDIITEIFKDKVNTFSELAYIIKNLKAGDEIKLVVLRDGKKEKFKGELGSRSLINGFNGNDMFRGLEGFPNELDGNQREFFFKFDGDEELELEGLEEQLEEMMREFENIHEDVDSEEFERELENLLSPYLENNSVTTEKVSISITIEPITESDLVSVNENAQVPLTKDANLEFGYISFFPNPNNGEFNLKFSLANDKSYKVLIYNQTGQTVYEEVSSSNDVYENIIDLTDMPSGPYYLQIVQDQKTYSRKIVKE